MTDPLAIMTQAPSSPNLLSEVLADVRLTGALFFKWEASWPFSMPVPDGSTFAPILLPGAGQAVSYHVVTAGRCWAGPVGGQPQLLEAGHILLVPGGASYVMASSAQACASAQVDVETSRAIYREMAGASQPRVVRDGGGSEQLTEVLCGFLGVDAQPFNPLLGALPAVLRLQTRAEGDPLAPLLDLALHEVREPGPGSQSVLLRTSELMFVELLRRCSTDLSLTDSGWLAALQQPHLNHALRLMHDHPAKDWTVARLARAVGQSRSRLAASFTRQIGQPPMQYLACWRMQLAARLLLDGDDKLLSVAAQVGYSSEAAFSRAFKRIVGVSPSAWRARER